MLFYALAGYGERFWQPYLDPDLLEDVRLDAIAQSFGVQPWEAEEISEYWINRRQLFERVRTQVREHQAKQK